MLLLYCGELASKEGRTRVLALAATLPLLYINGIATPATTRLVVFIVTLSLIGGLAGALNPLDYLKLRQSRPITSPICQISKDSSFLQGLRPMIQSSFFFLSGLSRLFIT